mgnify:CR=1 FL=1
MGFPISEYSSVGLRYTYQIMRVMPFGNAPLEIKLAAGDTYGSIFGFTYGYNSLDEWLDNFFYKLRAVALMAGAPSIARLQKSPLVITGATAAWLTARGIDISRWSLR